MHIETRIIDAKAIVTVTGRMDAVTSPHFEQTCSELLAQNQTDVLTDLSGLEYISSAGLRSVLASGKKLKAAGGRLSFCGLSGLVADVFRVSGFLKLFPIHASVAEALEG